jgi:hypothetical protein
MCECLNIKSGEAILQTKKYEITFDWQIPFDGTKEKMFGIYISRSEAEGDTFEKFNYCPWCGKQIGAEGKGYSIIPPLTEGKEKRSGSNKSPGPKPNVKPHAQGK